MYARWNGTTSYNTTRRHVESFYLIRRFLTVTRFFQLHLNYEAAQLQTFTSRIWGPWNASSDGDDASSLDKCNAAEAAADTGSGADQIWRADRQWFYRQGSRGTCSFWALSGCFLHLSEVVNGAQWGETIRISLTKLNLARSNISNRLFGEYRIG